jgi:hypothetical protein
MVTPVYMFTTLLGSHIDQQKLRTFKPSKKEQRLWFRIWFQDENFKLENDDEKR